MTRFTGNKISTRATKYEKVNVTKTTITIKQKGRVGT